MSPEGVWKFEEAFRELSERTGKDRSRGRSFFMGKRVDRTKNGGYHENDSLIGGFYAFQFLHFHHRLPSDYPSPVLFLSEKVRQSVRPDRPYPGFSLFLFLVGCAEPAHPAGVHPGELFPDRAHPEK